MTLQNSSDESFSNNSDGWSLGGGTATVRTLTLTGANFPISLSSPALNNLLQFNGTNWVNIPASTFGTGSVTQINTGTGLTGGPITSTGTISMTTSGVTAGTYGNATSIPQIVVDALGRITFAVTETALGSIATQNANNVNITGGTITGLPTPTSPTDAVNKSYVDNLTAGLTSHQSCRMATAGTNISATYNNGASGVGATLTYIATGAQTVDGVTPNVGDRILVKDQSLPAQNGIYVWTIVGAAGTSAVLTRATDFDQVTDGEVEEGAYTIIEEGTANKGTLWIETGQGPFTIGTTAITWTELSVANQSLTFTGDATGAGAGTIALTLATVNSNVGTFGNTTNIPQITVNAKGLITAISNTSITYGTGSVTTITAGSGLGTTTSAQGGTITNTGTLDVIVDGSTITNTGTLAVGTIQTANVANSAITYAKLQNESAHTILGNPGTASAAPSEISIGSYLTLGTNGTLSHGTSGVSAGTYNQVVVEPDGHITSGTTIPIGTSGAGFFLPGIVSNGGTNSNYYSALSAGSLQNTNIASNILFAIPVILPANVPLTRIGVDIITKGSTGSDIRLGIYSNGNGAPASLLLDAGTILIDTVGAKEIAISYTTTGAWIWLVAVHNSTSAATINGFSNGANISGLMDILGFTTPSGVTTSFISASMTFGTLGSSFPSPITYGTTNTPCFWVRSV